MSSSAPSASRIGRDSLTLLLVLGAAAALLWPSLRGGFLTDDYHNIRTVIYGPKHDESFDAENQFEALKFFYREKPNKDFELYRPLVAVGYALNARLGGTEAYGFQVVNLVLHLLGGLMLFLLARRLIPGAPSWALGAGALWFLISPVQLEVSFWTAARSESLSWVCGAIALYLKLGKPERRILPMIFAALALMSKESAIVFVPLLFLIDFWHPTRAETLSIQQRVLRSLSRGWPILLMLAVYFGVRHYIFGAFLGRYADRELIGPLAPEAFAAYSKSMMTALFPLSNQLFQGDAAWQRLPLALLFMAGTFLLAAATMFGLDRRLGRMLPLLVLLFAVPFVLGTLANVINAHLVNTRAMYTPFAALAVLLAASGLQKNAVLRYGPAICLILASLLSSRPSQELYLEANHGVEATLSGIRSAAKELPESTDTIVILGYQEQEYLGGGFTLSGAIDAALRRPFVDRDFNVLKVRNELAAPTDPTATHLFPFRSIDKRDARRTAFMVLVPGESEFREYETAYSGAFSRRTEDAVFLESPSAGSPVVLNALKPETLTQSFQFRVRGLKEARFAFTLFCATHQVITIPIRPQDVEQTPQDDGSTLWNYRLTVPADVITFLVNHEHYAWAITAYDGSGNQIAASGFRTIDIAILP